MYYIYTQLMVTHTQTPYIIKPYSLEGLLLLLVLLCQKQTTEFSAAFSKRYKSALLRSIIPANQKTIQRAAHKLSARPKPLHFNRVGCRAPRITQSIRAPRD